MELNDTKKSDFVSNLFPDLETRKKHTASILECTSNIIDPIAKDNKTKGYLILLFHLFICFPTYIYLLVGSYNLLYYACLILWIAIFIMHFYFNGCILIRMERHFFDDKEWKGVWSPLFNSLKVIGIEYSKSHMNNIFICSGVLLLLIVFLRYILHAKQ
jgi:hypothetical protein